MSDVVEAWQPATELEARLRDALQEGDQHAYFGLLRGADLVIPVAAELAEEMLANQAPPTWPTQEVDGRQYILAYTSPEAMRSRLAIEVQHFMKLAFDDLAEGWPEPGLWLAVNPGLPIQGLLPSWFVMQVADGDPLPPQAGPGGSAISATPAPDAEANVEADTEADAAEPAPAAEHTAAEHIEDEHTPAEEAAAVLGTETAATGAAGQDATREDTDTTEHDVTPDVTPDVTSDVTPADEATVEDESTAAPEGIAEGDTGEGDTGGDTDTLAAPDAESPSADEPLPDAEPQQEDQQEARLEEESRPEDEFQPANDVERELLRARTEDDEDAFIKALVEAEVLIRVPVDTDQALCPGRPGFPWQTTEVDGETSIAVFTSPDRMVEILGEPSGRSAGQPAGQDDEVPETDFMKFPFASIIRYWPEQAWTLAVDSGTPIGASLAGERLPGLAEWADQMVAQRMAEHFAPQNEVEQQLFDAAVRRDIDEFFAILLGAQVLVPADPETPWGIRPDDPDFPWRPVPVQGETSIQMFTSMKWMHDAIGPSRFVMPTFLDVVSAWPDLGWTLILNPATPIDAAVPGERVRELAAAPGPTTPPSATPAVTTPAVPASDGDPGLPTPTPFPDLAAAPVPQADPRPVQPPQPAAGRSTDSRPLPDFHPGNSIDQDLYETAVSGDTDAFLRVLLRTSVLVPIPADAPPEISPKDPRFRWEAALRDTSSVQVFTSHARLHDALGDLRGPDRAAAEPRFVSLDFRELIGCWPRAEWTLLVNPGTRIGASLRGDQVQALSEWAVRVGLLQHPAQDPDQHTVQPPVQPPVPTTPAQPQPWAQPAPAEQYPTTANPLANPLANPFAGQLAGPPTSPHTGPPGSSRSTRVMQKALPHSHVSWYLDQGYDRIGGFVHSAADVTELQTPRQLYEALGMLSPGSPFSPDDEGVYVIRWPAYCDDLYRIPFGGQSEEELRTWGDAGWVVENAPFHGDGFAPGSAGTIREYKVDSIRLPYGAEMYYLGRDRSEQFVAVYDPDRLVWLRPDDAVRTGNREQSGVAQ